jgi:hypothetical protein
MVQAARLPQHANCVKFKLLLFHRHLADRYNAKWTDPVGLILWAILTCIHAGFHDVKP